MIPIGDAECAVVLSWDNLCWNSCISLARAILLTCLALFTALFPTEFLGKRETVCSLLTKESDRRAISRVINLGHYSQPARLAVTSPLQTHTGTDKSYIPGRSYKEMHWNNFPEFRNWGHFKWSQTNIYIVSHISRYRGQLGVSKCLPVFTL